jgi:hypothetical protein
MEQTEKKDMGWKSDQGNSIPKIKETEQNTMFWTPGNEKEKSKLI